MRDEPAGSSGDPGNPPGCSDPDSGAQELLSDEELEGDGEDEEVGEAVVIRRAGGLSLTDGRRRVTGLAIKSFDAAGRPAVIEHRFVVEAECQGWRLDRFLMKRMRRVSRARIQRVILGDLDVNGVKVTRPAARVKTNDEVAFRRPAPSEPDVPREAPVLATDEVFYALDKPAGLPMHPTARYHYATLTAVLRERFPDEKLEICHRLDRETSGVVLIGRTRAAGPLIKRAFAKRLIKKKYLAIVHGEWPDAVGVERRIDLPLGAEGKRVRVRMAVVPVAEGGQPAVTTASAVRRYRGYTLVEARPETGRQHQIRAHLFAVGFPIVGDKLYPDEDRFLTWLDEGDTPALLASLELPRHALHAAALEFPHPFTGERILVESPLAADLEKFLAGLDSL